jgi:hypothetical protein
MKVATIRKYGIFMAIIGVILFLYLVYQRPVEGFQGAESKSVDLVVARYKENLDWLNKYKDSRFQNVFIYNKSDSPVEDCVIQYANCTIKTLPNVGVCDHTYLYHIIENYDRLADVTVFAPGSANLDYKDSIFKFTTDKAFTTKDTVLNTYKFDIDVDKAMYNLRMTHHVLASSENKDRDDFNNAPASPTPFGVWYRKYFPEVHTPYSSFFGIFAASKEHIRQRPKSFYQEMIQQVNTSVFHEASHFIERTWFSIFWPVPEKCIYVSPVITDAIDRIHGGFKRTRLAEGFATNQEIPIFIISYNQYTFVKSMVEQLRPYTTNIYVIDNKSTYEPLIEYLKEIDGNKATVLWMPENYGHKVYERDEIIALGGEKYIVTDPDLLLNPNLPPNFIEILAELSDKYKTNKIGFALDIKDNINIKKKYNGKTLPEHESGYWSQPVPDPNYTLYRADIDTTFALINKKYYVKGALDNSIRVAGDFTCKHRPWLNDWETDLERGELEHYLNTNNKSTTITLWK